MRAQVLNALPDGTHPMTQFCTLILALQVCVLGGAVVWRRAAVCVGGGVGGGVGI